MRILWRYFATRFTVLFFSFLAISLIGIAGIEMLLNFDQILATREFGGGLWVYLTLRLPAYYLPDLLPVAAFGAAFFTLASSGQARELMAMKAGGISPHSASAPILIVASLLSIGALVLDETWVRHSSLAWSRLQAEGAAGFALSGGTFWYHSDRALYNVREVDTEARELEGVRIFELGPEGLPVRIIEATRGRFDPSRRHWQLEDGWIRHFETAHPGWPAAAEPFAQHALSLSPQAGRALREADASLLPLPQLWRRVADRSAQGLPTRRLQQRLHARMARPASVAVLALLALPLGLRVDGVRALGRRSLEGIVLVAAFFALRSAGGILASHQLIPSAAASFGLLAGYAGFALVWLRGVPR